MTLEEQVRTLPQGFHAFSTLRSEHGVEQSPGNAERGAKNVTSHHTLRAYRGSAWWQLKPTARES
jgi:hypothetical protein